MTVENQTAASEKYLYKVRESFITPTEREYLTAIKKILPKECYLQPQVSLRSIIDRTDDACYQNELYRIIDACIFDKSSFKPLVLIEINDSSHNQPKRIERDKKVKMICEEAGIPLVTFWVKYGVNEEYIEKRILEGIEQSKNPVRVAHSKNKIQEKSSEIDTAEASKAEPKSEKASNSENSSKNKTQPQTNSSGGCYIATCVYGSYDCPEVWTLRRFRDNSLAKTFLGRTFIHVYYAISPKLVKRFGKKKWFIGIWKKQLDHMVLNLKKNGFEDTPYYDIQKGSNDK